MGETGVKNKVAEPVINPEFQKMVSEAADKARQVVDSIKYPGFNKADAMQWLNNPNSGFQGEAVTGAGPQDRQYEGPGLARSLKRGLRDVGVPVAQGIQRTSQSPLDRRIRTAVLGEVGSRTGIGGERAVVTTQHLEIGRRAINPLAKQTLENPADMRAAVRSVSVDLMAAHIVKDAILSGGAHFTRGMGELDAYLSQESPIPPGTFGVLSGVLNKQMSTPKDADLLASLDDHTADGLRDMLHAAAPSEAAGQGKS